MIGKTGRKTESLPLFVGTSGWFYEDWQGRFYPSGLRQNDWLSYYAARFNTVELNVSFYRLPFENMIIGWRKRVPNGFLFAAKGTRIVTHRKRLRRVKTDIARFLERIGQLGPRLGPILWQLPPGLKRDLQRLDRFLKMLPPTFRYAVEFRNRDWLVPAVYEKLKQHQAALVSVSSLRMPADFTVTASFVYLRFHGLAGGFAHDYTADELSPWTEYAAACLKKGLSVFAYFNNDALSRAPENALHFRDMVLNAL